MSIRFYQLGDYENTMFRKVLENDAATLAGTQTMNTASGSGTRAPRFYASGDGKNTMLRKLLENQAQVLAGNSIFHVS